EPNLREDLHHGIHTTQQRSCYVGEDRTRTAPGGTHRERRVVGGAVAHSGRGHPASADSTLPLKYYVPWHHLREDTRNGPHTTKRSGFYAGKDRTQAMPAGTSRRRRTVGSAVAHRSRRRHPPSADYPLPLKPCVL